MLAILVAGCGRIGFDGGPDDGAGDAADEDGDGLPDAVDPCPHLPGTEADADGDGVGDACDPEPQLARQRISLFVPFAEGAPQPFTLNGPGTWTPEPGALHFDGAGYGELLDPTRYGAVRVALGIDVLAVVGAGIQHQLAVPMIDDDSGIQTFAELNEVGTASYAGITRYDGAYTRIAEAPLMADVHPGPLFLQTTYTLDAGAAQVALSASWPGEAYDLAAVATSYARGRLRFNVNNVELRLRYVVIIATAP